MKINKEKMHNNLSTLIILSFYGVRTLSVVNGASIFTILSLVLGISALIYLFYSKVRMKLKVVINFSILYFLMVITAAITGNVKGGVIFNIQYIGIGLLLLHSKINDQYVKKSFYIHAFYLLSFIIKGAVPAEAIYLSRNQISSIIIVQSVLFYVSKLENKKAVDVLPAFITLIISIWATGRSGIVSALVLVMSVVPFKKFKENKKQVWGLSTIVFFIFTSTEMFSKALQSIKTNYNILKIRFMTESVGARSLILKEYIRISTIDLKSFFWGGKLRVSDYLTQGSFDTNLHISYLGLHAYYGFLGMIIIIIHMVSGIWYLLTNNKLMHLGLLLVLLVRVSTDTLAFPGYYDPLIYFFLFYRYYEKTDFATT